MAFLTQLLRDVRQIMFRDAEQHAIPPLDGAFSPNDRLDACLPIGGPLLSADDVVEGDDGALFVSAGPRVLRLSGEGYVERSVFAQFDNKAGGLAMHPDGRLLVCVAGRGLAAVDAGGRQSWLNQAADQPLRCLTSVAAATDGTIFASEGSSRYEPDDWCRDLMEKSHSGRLVACGPGLEGAKVLLGGLYYPYGLAISVDQRHLWFTESWAHRISRAEIGARTIATPNPVIGNLPGYPARLGRAATDGFWLSLFAVRTHLIEFVLREDDYRNEMMRTIPQAFWIAPTLAATGHVLEPMQSGSVKALGIHKPWAPPRSYGLVARVDSDGEAQESLHSRVGGAYHGITAACETAQGLVIVSNGSGRLVLQKRGAPT
jgi:sugar lactone lactonase YvrE